MYTKPAIMALLFLLTSTCLRAQEYSHQSRLGLRALLEPASQTRELQQPARAAFNGTLVPYLQNGDIETTDAEGLPQHWTIFRDAAFDADPSLAYSGAVSIRASGSYGWTQELLTPVSPYQTFTLFGHFSHEFPGERAALRTSYWRQDGSYLKDGFAVSKTYTPPGQYLPFWIPQEVPEQAHSVFLFPRGESLLSWIRFDDLHLFTEQYAASTSATGEAWALNSGALLQDNSIVLPPGASASQRVAAGIENQSYFTWGRYTADGSGELTLEETWLYNGGDETTATGSAAQSFNATGGTVFLDPGRPVDMGSGLVSVTLSNPSSSTITLSELRRGFAKVEPSTLVAGPASPDGSLKLTAAWPGNLTSATVEILADSGTYSASPTTAALHGTSLRCEWDPASAPGGSYTARFLLESNDGLQVVVSRPFTVVREDEASPVVPAFRSDEYLRGIWLFAQRGFSRDYTMQTFQKASEDGYNFAIVLAEAVKLPDVREAAEAVGMKFVAFVPEVVKLHALYRDRTWFSKVDYLSKVKDILSPILGSPYYVGFSVTDEPSTPDAFEALRRANLSVAQDGTLGSPFTVYLGPSPFEEIAASQPAAGLVDLYPYFLPYATNPTSAVLQAIQLENDKAKSFAAIGRDLLYLPQAFIDLHSDYVYPVTSEMYAAQLGGALLAGARGTIPFYYNTTFGTPVGMLDRNLQPTPLAEPFREFNALMQRIGSLVMQLEVPTLAEDAPHPFAVSSTSDQAGNTYVYVLNADDATTQTLFMQFSQQLSNAPYDVVSERYLPIRQFGTVRVELGAGQWALFSVGQGKSLVGMAALPADAPDYSTLDLPVDYQFLVPRLDGSGQPPLSLEFNPSGSTLAASIGVFSFEPAAPMFFHLSPDGQVIREPGPIAFPAERYGFIDDNLYYVASPSLGMRVYAPGGLFGSPVAEYKGHSGGAYDVLRDGNRYWLTLSDLGIREVLETPGGLTSVALGASQRGSYRDLFGPFENGSVTTIVNNYWVSNVKPGQLNESQHTSLFVLGVARGADLNAQNLLATPRHQYGAAVFRLSETGQPELLQELATDTLDASAVTWINNRVLAVADGYRNIRFYEIKGTQSTLIGTWQPPTIGDNYIISLAAAGDRLAVGTFSGQVFVANTEMFRSYTAAEADWQLFE